MFVLFAFLLLLTPNLEAKEGFFAKTVDRLSRAAEGCQNLLDKVLGLEGDEDEVRGRHNAMVINLGFDNRNNAWVFDNLTEGRLLWSHLHVRSTTIAMRPFVPELKDKWIHNLSD